MKGTLKKGSAVLDSCTGNWLHHLEWEKGVSAAEGSSKRGSKASASSSAAPVERKRLWDRKSSPAPSSVPVEGALPSDCRHREDLVHLMVRGKGAGRGGTGGQFPAGGGIDQRVPVPLEGRRGRTTTAWIDDWVLPCHRLALQMPLP